MSGRSGPGVDEISLRHAVRFVAFANLGYFGIEFAVALAIGSVSLIADSVDFLEDASVNFLILISLAWSARSRAKVGMLLAAILVIPGIATLSMAWQKFHMPVPPAAAPLSLAGAGALVVNLTCALMLVRHRHAAGSLAKAAFLSARNDVIANLAIIGTGILTLYVASAWPDLVVGLVIATINAGAAWEVWEAARSERRAAES